MGPKDASGAAGSRSIIITMAWYTEADWLKVRALADDAGAFDATYAAWERGAERAMEAGRSAGQAIEKCWVRPDELMTWCLAHRRPNDAAARAEYVAQRRRGLTEPGA